MMSTFAKIFLLISALTFVASLGTPESRKAQKEACFEEHPLNDDEKKSVLDDKMMSKGVKNPSKELQCFVLCYYKKLGLVAPNLQRDNTVIYKYMEDLVEDKSTIAGKLKKCATVTGENECALAYNFEKCIVDQIS